MSLQRKAAEGWMCSHDTADRTHDVFVGRKQPIWIFDYQLDGLFSVVELGRNRAEADPRLYEATVRRASEAALVNSLGFFEAFSKHQFAALLNIYPALLRDFALRRPESAVPLSALASVESLDASLGFIIAEQYDFGTAKKVNGLFRDLVCATPFDRDEAEHLDFLIAQRNLIVHHGGIYTLQSARLERSSTEATFGSEVLWKAEAYYKAAEFLRHLAAKLVSATVAGLRRQSRELAAISEDRRQAVRCLSSAVWDVIPD